MSSGCSGGAEGRVGPRSETRRTRLAATARPARGAGEPRYAAPHAGDAEFRDRPHPGAGETEEDAGPGEGRGAGRGHPGGGAEDPDQRARGRRRLHPRRGPPPAGGLPGAGGDDDPGEGGAGEVEVIQGD